MNNINMEKIGETPKPRFKVGDTVTYKPRYGDYFFGGDCMGGKKGVIIEVGYNTKNKCFEIVVTTPKSGMYSMLESEFVEWDTPQPTDNYPIY